MASRDDSLRNDLIKRFAASVIAAEDALKGIYYICPTCKHTVSRGMTNCIGCNQKLSWKISKKRKLQTEAKK